MAIIISKNGKNAKKVEKSDFEKEDYLQQYIYQNPESIPLYDIKEDIKLLILAREFSTDSGPIDAIGVDRDGEIYLIETKLYKNADKRLVVAQVLDYGASLWSSSLDFGEVVNRLEDEVNAKFGIGLHQKLHEFFGFEEDQVSVLLENMRKNLNEGRFKFVVLMDKLHDQLKDLIIFLNENSKFDIFAVELEYYKHEDYEIMIPKLFGAEVKKEIGVSSSGSRKKWNEQTLLQDAKEKLSDEEYKAFEKIYNFSKENAEQINFGTGSYGTFSPIFSVVCSKSLFTLGTDKRLSLNFEWVAKIDDRVAELFKEKVASIGFKVPENYKQVRPSVLLDEWLSKTDDFIRILKEMIQS